MGTAGEARRGLWLDVAGVGAGIDLPPALEPDLRGRVWGPAGPPPAEVAVDYRVTDEGRDRFGLERDQGGLRRAVDGDGALRALVTDLGEAVHRRRPDIVLGRGGAVTVEGRGVVVLGPQGGGTSTLVAALVEAGAALLSDGIVVLGADGLVHPVVVSGDGLHPGGDAGGPPAAAPVTLLVTTSFEPSEDGDRTEVAGVRAVLGLLEHLSANHQRTPTARELITRVATQAVEWRGPRPEAASAAAEMIARAKELPLVDPPPAAAGPASPATAPRSTPARFLRFDDLLADDEHDWLLDHALTREAELLPSSVLTEEEVGDEVELRRSRTAYDLDELWPLFERRIVRLLPHIRRELGLDWFELSHVERQLTVSGDGDHFTLHVDNAGPEVASRMVSAIYYFNREPRRFTGGELRLFDTVERDGVIQPAGAFTEVVPADNTLVVFPGHTPHEVRPVHVPGDDFADRRFTVVFWVHRTPTPAELFGADRDTRADRQRDLLPALTEDGFRVVPTPAPVRARLAEAFAAGADSGRAEAADPAILLSGEPTMVDLGELGPEALTGLQAVHEDWCGLPLEPTAVYGIRSYQAGQSLARHVDRVETHVISSVVHIDADVDEPWPLQVEDRHGATHDVVLEPGQMLLYEGARLPHGRPEPLQGRHHASVFLHYRPLDWSRTLQRVCREADPARDRRQAGG